MHLYCAARMTFLGGEERTLFIGTKGHDRKGVEGFTPVHGSLGVLEGDDDMPYLVLAENLDGSTSVYRDFHVITLWRHERYAPCHHIPPG